MIKLVILVTCFVLLGSREAKGDTCPCPDDVDIKPPDMNKPSVFQDLTTLEIDGVLKYLQEDSGLNVKVGYEAKISDTIAYIIEKKPTPKNEVLNHIDRDGRKPVRESRVILATLSEMIEYTVGPLPNPTYHRKTKYPKWRATDLKFTDRPWPIDSLSLLRTVQREGRKMKQLLHESFNGFDFEDDCGNKCLKHYDLKMNVFQSNRVLWLNVLRVVPPSIGARYVYPLPLQILVNITSTDPDFWKAIRVWYNGQYFDSTDDLMTNYINGSVQKIVIPYNESDVYSSMRRRGTSKTRSTKRGPDCFPQDGRRYSVDGHRVKYMDWEFEFTYRQTTGPQLFDIQFKKERIVYELSFQEILLSYTGTTPFGSQAGVFFDSEALLGNSFSPLSPGVDCPKGATYFDSSIFAYVLGEIVFIPNIFCIFEYRDEPALKRHYDNDYFGGYEFYGGMPNNALVLRSIISSYNYDYIFSFIFYQNGVIGTKVSASGYVHCEFINQNVPIEDTIGFKLNENVLSMFHQHLFSFKVDVDILGENNSHETLAVKVRQVTHDVVDGIQDDTYEQYLKRKHKSSEKQAVYRFQYNQPKYYLFYNNEARRSKLGYKRAYYLDNQSVSKFLFPDKWSKMGSAAWAKYQLAVTKRHDDEDTSSTPYSAYDMVDPVLNFDSYISDNENITDKDLVAWVTVGMQHLPNSATDVPVTTTSGNTLSFFLKPFNFFDEDPSTSSYDNVFITPGKNGEAVVEENENNAKESCSHPNDDPNFVGDYWLKP